jgi:hypothetical protein
LFLLGGVLGGFIGWTIHPEPPPIVSLSEKQLREPPVTVQLVAATQQENSISADLGLIVRGSDGTVLASQEIQVKADPKTEPTTVRTDGNGKAPVSITYGPSEKERLITVKHNGTEVGQVNFPLPKIEPRIVEKPTGVPPPITIAVTRTALEEDDRIRAELEISVKDENGKPQSEIQVQLTSTRGNADTLIFEKNNRTDQQGRVKVQLMSKQFGTRTIAVTHNGEPVGQDEIYLPKIEPRTEIKTVIQKQFDPIEIEVKSATVQDNNRIEADLELTVRNPAGTPLANREIQVTMDSKLPPTKVRTDDQGKAIVPITYSQPETRLIRIEEVGEAKIYLPEFSPRTEVKEVIKPAPVPPPKRLVRLKVEGSDNVPLTDATVKMNGKSVTANKDGFFETEVEENQNAIEVEVKKEDYETPQGESIYKRSFPLDVVEGQVYPFQVHNFTVTLSPVLFYVEVPPEALENLPDVPLDKLKELKYQFYVGFSPGKPPKVKADLEPDRKGISFSSDLSLNLDKKSIWIGLWRGTPQDRLGKLRDPLWKGMLPFRKYEKTQP